MTHAQTETLAAGAELVLIALLVFMAEAVEVLEGTRRFAVLCADSSVVLPMLGDESVGVTLTDPPYAPRAMKNARSATMLQRRDGKIYDFGYAALTNEQRRQQAREYARITQRWCVVWCDIESDHAWRVRLVRAGLQYVRTAVWFRENGAPQFSGDRPAQDLEACVIAHPAGRKRWNGGGCGASRKGPIVNAASEDRAHTSPKPLWLMLGQVEDFTDPDEVVLDPFAGSGTTGVACLRLGRRFIGIEKSPEYAAIARERLAAESQGLTLRDARAGQQSLFGDAR